ncbi:gamma-glutamyltransferase [Alteribacillus iranensis]|uniref:Glutathione hydrolase proenzyme n=1 Tax=Alteribacillus iranensis TaxID=930128 RepID=A0A1I2BXQ7_9BACI|nr:gamma-glutamyltransferase [Alteribacillus iranensis]SFE60712.1 gamma-glutamyltransferase 1 Threonine peptidase. MEROPS family T03 [Alteribacillus iranensis]
MIKHLTRTNMLTVILIIAALIVIFIVFHMFTKDKSVSDDYGVSAAHPLAVEVGMNVLEEGGNAVDAAVAVSYALSVVEPAGSGLGGGGAMVIASPHKEPVAYDYREVMPSTGELPEDNIGVPGFVKGMEEVHSDFGQMDREALIQPAIELAKNGISADQVLTERLESEESKLAVEELSPFFPKGEVIQPGEKVIQKELVDTLKIIQEEGASAFYEGELGKSIVDAVEGLSMEDFNNYSVQKHDAVHGELGGYNVYSAPPPLGGLTLIEMLQTAEAMDIEKARETPADFIHVLSEIATVSYQDRLRYIADMNFTNVPIQQLSSKEYAQEKGSAILFNQLSKVNMKNDDSEAGEDDHSDTTHFVIYDSDGMMVSVTNSLSHFFGSGQYVRGMFLNNQLKNFSKNPSSPNVAEAGKRPRSFMAPTILTKDEKPALGIGSPGGKRIPMVMAQVILRHLVFGESMQTAINQPRFYIEEGEIDIEEDFSDDIKEELTSRGYDWNSREAGSFFGGIQSLYVDHKNNRLTGGADLRRNGTWNAKSRRERE